MIQLGNFIVSDEDLAVIAHVVEDETPEQWVLRVFNYPKGGEAAVRAKIARHRPGYLAARGAAGYQNAAGRAATQRAADQAANAKRRADKEARKVTEEAALDARIAAEVARQVADRS